MGEGTKIVTEHYPAAKLPEELRRGLAGGEWVRVTVETGGEPAGRPLTSFLGSGKGSYPSPEDAVQAIRSLRDEWQ